MLVSFQKGRCSLPLVNVYYDREKVAWRMLLRLREILPRIVAARLSTDNTGNLSASDISIIFHRFDELDIREHPLQIIIHANYSRTRATWIETAARLITRDINDETSTEARIMNFYVWVLLANGGFAEVKYTKTRKKMR